MKMVLAAAFSILAGPALAASPEEDVQRFIAIFQQSDATAQNRAVEDLAWMGLSDLRLFDPIEQRILAEERAARESRAEKDRIARYMRALGFSGRPKYRSTLNRFTLDQVYMRYADQAIKDLPYYQRWNPIISARADWDPNLSDEANRVMNMLRSDDLLLQRIAAKRVWFGIQDEPALDLLAARLRDAYPKEWQGEEADSVAWMAKALGRADKGKYRSLLDEVVAGSPTRGVRNQAASALRQR
jgi:hypothetical protein